MQIRQDDRERERERKSYCYWIFEGENIFIFIFYPLRIGWFDFFNYDSESVFRNDSPGHYYYYYFIKGNFSDRNREYFPRRRKMKEIFTYKRVRKEVEEVCITLYYNLWSFYLIISNTQRFSSIACSPFINSILVISIFSFFSCLY